MRRRKMWSSPTWTGKCTGLEFEPLSLGFGDGNIEHDGLGKADLGLLQEEKIHEGNGVVPNYLVFCGKLLLYSLTMASNKVSLKLLIDTNTEKVLFAEASKEFIDFLFNLLRLPIGTVIRLLTKNGMVGCLGKLYESIENLNDTYLLNPRQGKEVVLKPSVVIPGFLLPASDAKSDNKSVPLKLYMCSKRCSYDVTDTPTTSCPNLHCYGSMNTEVKYIIKGATKETHSGEGGFVKEVVTYMVMDDLVVQPMSTISCITMLNKFNVKDVGSLQEKVVELGMEEGIKLLKASLQSNSALTTTFLKNMET
ncbi:DUF674 family protein [Senna tora]|uniref:DUF674 family protein n=1 Tax=Senna tora TaxID=362788 RepID=A0A834W6R9_9FABA|nr:DUF674 family protein [Senna tora]